jgi:hypothetical protein
MKIFSFLVLASESAQNSADIGSTIRSKKKISTKVYVFSTHAVFTPPDESNFQIDRLVNSIRKEHQGNKVIVTRLHLRRHDDADCRSKGT